MNLMYSCPGMKIYDLSSQLFGDEVDPTWKFSVGLDFYHR